MARQILNNNESANIFRTKLNDNFTDLYANKATTNHASASTTYGVGSTSLFGHVKITNGNGLSVNGGTVAMSAASTSVVGTVQLVDNATTANSSMAATANALKQVADAAIKTFSGNDNPTSSIGKDSDLYVKLL